MGLQEKWDNMLGLVTGTNDPVTLKAVIEVQKEMSQLLQENQELRQEIHDLKNEQILDSELELDKHFLYKKHDNTNQPYCLKCWDSDRKLIRGIRMRDMYGIEVVQCTRCEFMSDLYREN